jgi:hypothetical protein
MRTLSQEYTEDDQEGGDEDDSLEEDAKRNIEGKFLFHSRFHHVLNTLHRETTLPQRPSSSDGKGKVNRVGASSKLSLKTQSPAPSTQSMFLNNLANNRKSFSVFESSDDVIVANQDTSLPFTTAVTPAVGYGVTVTKAPEEENSSTTSGSLCFSNSTFDEDSNQKRTLASPRAAMIREGHVRYQIPYVVKELVGNVDVDQTSIISLAGHGIGDEKMLCLVQSLPYFVNVDEINISSTEPFVLLPFL